MEKRFGRGKQSYLGDLLTMVINHFLNGMIRTPWFKSPLSGSGCGTPSKWPFMEEINGGEPLKQVLGWSSKCIPKKFHIGPWKVTAAQERIVFYPCIQIQRLCYTSGGVMGRWWGLEWGFLNHWTFIGWYANIVHGMILQEPNRLVGFVSICASKLYVPGWSSQLS